MKKAGGGTPDDRFGSAAGKTGAGGSDDGEGGDDEEAAKSEAPAGVPAWRWFILDESGLMVETDERKVPLFRCAEAAAAWATAAAGNSLDGVAGGLGASGGRAPRVAEVSVAAWKQFDEEVRCAVRRVMKRPVCVCVESFLRVECDTDAVSSA